jgi:MOSC domain-containing protein YiiM
MPDESQTDTRRRTRLLQVRTGVVKQLGNGDVLSAIDKAARDGPVWLGPEGLEGDEQREREFHGGADKAALHYCADH